MQRDLLSLPHDDNGDALWHAVQNGLALGEAHRVRFSLAFPAYVNAFQFGCFLLRQGYRVQVNEADGDAGDEVLLEMGLNVTHTEISGAETWLREHAAELEGLPSGW
jgi:hypothetical protein